MTAARLKRPAGGPDAGWSRSIPGSFDDVRAGAQEATEHDGGQSWQSTEDSLSTSRTRDSIRSTRETLRRYGSVNRIAGPTLDRV